MSIELNKKQLEGVKIAVSRYNDRKPWTCISGYAGVGKSTLVSFIIEALHLTGLTDVCYVAYTGKASLVLKEKGCPNACTAHKLLYDSFPRADGTFYHKPKAKLPKYKLIVVDEVSMLPKEMWDLLLSHRIHVIALGDPGQLSPLGEPNGILDEPHIFLDEIMRQAQESEIIQLTMDIRAGKPLQLFQGKEVQIIDKKDVVSGMYFWADQIICAKNETRKEINQLMREYLYGDKAKEVLLPGEKVICLKNYWDEKTELDDLLVNGSIGTVHDIWEDKNTGNRFVDSYLWCKFLPEYYNKDDADDMFFNPYFNNLKLDSKLLKTGEPTVNKDNFKKINKTLKPHEFDYGYCITGWKSQGSEFDNVLVFEENFPFDKEEHKKFLYTCATRAKKKLVIVRK